VKCAVVDPDGQQAEKDMGNVANRVFPAKMFIIYFALYQRIYNIRQEEESQYAKEPFTPAEEIILVPRVILYIVGIQEGAKKKKSGDEYHDKEIFGESPAMQVMQRHLPPPEMHQHDKNVSYPGKMYPVGFIPVRVLDEFSAALQQVRKTKAEYKANDHTNVSECFHSEGVFQRKLLNYLQKESPD
jgi:hypothetical protein